MAWPHDGHVPAAVTRLAPIQYARRLTSVSPQAGQRVSSRSPTRPAALPAYTNRKPARLPIPDVCAAALAVPGVLGCHSIRTRGAEAAVHVDLHVQVDPAATVTEGHRVAEAVERAVCERFPEVADVLVHLEPYDEYQRQKTKNEGAGA